MITVLPADTPVTIPVVGPTVATVVVLLVHSPPGTASVNAVLSPVHKEALPVIGNLGLTVIILLAVQLPPIEYVMVAVPPATPLTTPVPLIVATAVLLLVQPPPPGASLSVIVSPWHTDDGPVIIPGVALTVTVVVAVQPKEYVINTVPAPVPVTIPPVPAGR
jgi:hypothetical protein